MFRVYAFPAEAHLIVPAETEDEARTAAQAFKNNGIETRIYAQTHNKWGDTVETLVE